MKTREEYIEAVKVKLEEISPFKEPDHFIDGTSDPDFDCVKPIVSYIEKNLDEAAQNCLRSLPLSLLQAASTGLDLPPRPRWSCPMIPMRS